MKLTSFKDLFAILMNDVHCIEECSLKVLPVLAQKAHSKELKKALENHLQETKDQIKRTEKACTKCQVSTASVEWENPIKAIFDNAERFINENTPSALLDAAIIAIVQKIEHLQIAAYGTLAEYSKVIDEPEVKAIIAQSLKEEKQVDTLLTKLAKGGFFEAGINVAATKR